MPDEPTTKPTHGVSWVRRNGHAKADFARAPHGSIRYDARSGQPRTGRIVTMQADISGLETLTDLLAATGQGDRRAFARLYKRSAPTLFAVAMRLMRHRAAAEDVVQEAYAAIWRRAGQYRADRGQPMAWMAAVVRNRAIDRLRKQTREPDVAASVDDLTDLLPDAGAGSTASLSVVGAALRECLGRLNGRQRRAILLAYYGGLTHEELAIRLDAPLGTVKSAVRRGLAQLKECLDR
jgi:RNA polymerase sigma-70 factor (ECF subfamily)